MILIDVENTKYYENDITGPLPLIMENPPVPNPQSVAVPPSRHLDEAEFEKSIVTVSRAYSCSLPT